MPIHLVHTAQSRITARVLGCDECWVIFILRESRTGHDPAGMAHIEVFDAPSQHPLHSPNISFALQPFIRLLTLRHAVDDLLLELPDAPGQLVNRKRIAQYASRTRVLHLAVHRWDNSVYYKTIQPEAYTLLQAIAKREPLNQALGLLPGNVEIGAVQEWFTEWTQFGWLCERE